MAHACAKAPATDVVLQAKSWDIGSGLESRWNNRRTRSG
jgi:hypothetical protein